MMHDYTRSDRLAVIRASPVAPDTRDQRYARMPALLVIAIAAVLLVDCQSGPGPITIAPSAAVSALSPHETPSAGTPATRPATPGPILTPGPSSATPGPTLAPGSSTAPSMAAPAD